jgi:hypothetical protein
MQQMKGALATARERLAAGAARVRAWAVLAWAQVRKWAAAAWAWASATAAGIAARLRRSGAGDNDGGAEATAPRGGGLRLANLRERIGALRLPLLRREPREPKGLLGDGTTPLARFAPPKRTRPNGMWLAVMAGAVAVGLMGAVLGILAGQRATSAQAEAEALRSAEDGYVEQVLAMSRELASLREQVAALRAGEPVTSTPVPTPTPTPVPPDGEADALVALTAERDALAAQLTEAQALLARITLGEPVEVRTGSGGGSLAPGQTDTTPLSLLSGQALRVVITCVSDATPCQVSVLTPDGRTAQARSFLGATTLVYTNEETPGTHLLTVQANGGPNTYAMDYAITDGYAR